MSGEFDQQLAGFRDGFPRMWWALYEGAKDAGFTDAQAFALVQTYVLGLGGKVHPPDPQPGPPKKEIE